MAVLKYLGNLALVRHVLVSLDMTDYTGRMIFSVMHVH